MCVSKASLTVYFEPPFWVGLYRREDGDGCRVCKTIFGREPRDQEIWEWLLASHRKLRFSPPVSADGRPRPSNPKRLSREARKVVQAAPTGTKAQQALQLQREQQKAQRQAHAKERREAELERKFALRQKKRRQKRRGH